MIKTADLAQGHWPIILAGIGIDRRFLRNRHGPCVLCGGKDRARFDDKDGRGTFFCNQCRSYTGFDVIMRTKGVGFREAAEMVEAGLPDSPAAEPRATIDRAELRRRRVELWSQSLPITAGDPVHLWFHRRLGEMPLDEVALSNLRYHPGVQFEGGRYPAMLAKVIQHEGGKGVQLHRTFLTLDGHKALEGGSRALTAGETPKGCYVPLGRSGEVLGIAEGIETALAASLMRRITVHAALNASNLEHWTPPPTTKTVIVFGDNDVSYTGQVSAYRLAQRLMQARAQGKLECTVEVKIPETVGADWNRILADSL